MSKTSFTLLLVCLTLLGASLLYWSRKLSVRYNAWTTSFRERHPHTNPPPTPQKRELNAKIMTWLFRLLGAIFLLGAVFLLFSILELELIGTWNPN